MLEDFASGWTWSDLPCRQRLEYGSMLNTAAAACRLMWAHSKNYVSPTKKTLCIARYCGHVSTLMLVNFISGWTWRGIIRRKRLEYGSILKPVAAACCLLWSHSKNYVSPTQNVVSRFNATSCRPTVVTLHIWTPCSYQAYKPGKYIVLYNFVIDGGCGGIIWRQ
jgi:hypothetical protein